MCGIAGIFDQSASTSGDELQASIAKMLSPLLHRGPDFHDNWSDPSKGIALGHTRLSIIDTSAKANQPMVSHCGRYQLSYNGEIYNFPELREQLSIQGHTFTSTSDTEVILTAISAWGLDRAIQQFNGMFAFALWDAQENKLYLVRDRLGIKPHYYYYHQGCLLFASELKAITAHPQFTKAINLDSVSLLLQYQVIPGTHSIYQHTHKVRPGTIITISQDEPPQSKTYWSVNNLSHHQAENLSLSEAKQELKSLLKQSVQQRLVSDVPLGAFLSGGIDSSLVVAIMQEYTSDPVKTFTIGFENQQYNEAHFAKAVANHLNTDHTELIINTHDAQAIVPKLANMYDEPFADVSQIPTYLVSALAKNHVTVCLSGDGGDESFAGYSRIARFINLWHKMNRLPKSLRHLLSYLMNNVPAQFWPFILPRTINPAHKMHKLSKLFSSQHPIDAYLTLNKHWQTPNELLINNNINHALTNHVPSEHLQQSILLHELTQYLPDDVLTKVDRASMAVSLEVRVPLLDHNIVEFAWQLPFDYKIHNHQGKWLLKQILQDYLPTSLIDRPKMGFGVPMHDWLRGDLKNWANDLLNPSELQKHNIFNSEIITKYWLQHLSGKADWTRQLWPILMFQSWYLSHQKN